MILLGTTGFEYENSQLDSFYPVDLQESNKRLEYYASIAPVVELHSTFYELPSMETVQMWHENTPKRFDFIGRMLKDVTFCKDNKSDPNLIAEYFNRLKPLKSKLSVVILHFRGNLQSNEKNQQFILELIADCKKHYDGHISLELPNRSWFNDMEFNNKLHEDSVSIVNTDKLLVPASHRHQEVFYLRLRGSTSLVPKEAIGKKVIDRQNDIKYWAKYLRNLSKRHKMVFIIFDNHFSGNAFLDAVALAQELKGGNVKFKGFLLDKSKNK